MNWHFCIAWVSKLVPISSSLCKAISAILRDPPCHLVGGSCLRNIQRVPIYIVVSLCIITTKQEQWQRSSSWVVSTLCATYSQVPNKRAGLKFSLNLINGQGRYFFFCKIRKTGRIEKMFCYMKIRYGRVPIFWFGVPNKWAGWNFFRDLINGHALIYHTRAVWIFFLKNK